MAILEAEANDQEIVEVVTSSGGIMELDASHATVTASTITDKFPGHGIFRELDLSHPLLDNEELHPREIYRLLPLDDQYKTPIKTPNLYQQNSGACTPYRMSSCDSHQRKKADSEAFPRFSKKSSGVWKVNLVTSPEELLKILSQGAKTKELVDSARTVAKCGSTRGSSVAGSEQWSTVSGRWTEI